MIARTPAIPQPLVHVSPRQAMPLVVAGAVILDVRDGPFERNGRAFGVDAVVEISWRDVAARLGEVPGGVALIVADCVGIHSKPVAEALLAHGFTDVANLVGGIVAWEDAGLPVRIDKDAEMRGSCVCQLRPKKAFHRT